MGRLRFVLPKVSTSWHVLMLAGFRPTIPIIGQSSGELDVLGRWAIVVHPLLQGGLLTSLSMHLAFRLLFNVGTQSGS